MQERFCLQLRCAGVSAATEQGDKGTGRPISSAVLLPFFFSPPSLLPAQATLIQSSFWDVGLLQWTWVPGTAAKKRERNPEPGHNLAAEREKKRRRWRWGGIFGIFFFFSPFFLFFRVDGRRWRRLICFAFFLWKSLAVCDSRAGGEAPAVKIPDRHPPATARAGTRGAEPPE